MKHLSIKLFRENVAMATGKSSIIDRTMQDTWLMKKAEKELRILFSLLVVIIAVVAYLFFN